MPMYKNREVNIVNENVAPSSTNQEMVQIQHKEPGMEGALETVPRASIVFSKEENQKRLDAKRQAIKDEEEAYNRDQKAREDSEKREVALAQERAKAQEKNLPANAYLQNGTYSIGDQVVVDGVVYKSRVNGNTGNAPSEKSDQWVRVRQEPSNVVTQNRTPQVPLGEPVVIGDKTQATKRP